MESQNEFNIRMSEEIDGRVDTVCNLSEGIYNRGILEGEKRGLKKGERRGLKKGEIKKAKQMVYKLSDRGMPCDEIADVVEFGTDIVREWIAEREAASAR